MSDNAQHELTRAKEAFGDLQGRTLAEAIEIRQAAWRQEANRLGAIIQGLRDLNRLCHSENDSAQKIGEIA